LYFIREQTIWSRSLFAQPAMFSGFKELSLSDKDVKSAKAAPLIKNVKVSFLPEGPDRTIDDFSKFSKNVNLANKISPQHTVLELRNEIAKQEMMNIADINIYCGANRIADSMTVGQCFVDWMGFGIDTWVPQLKAKGRLVGFEVYVDVPPMRDNSVWVDGRMHAYQGRHLIIDVDTGMTVFDMKKILAKIVNVAPAQQMLTAQMLRNKRGWGEFVELSDDQKTLGDYEIDSDCTCIKFEKMYVDQNGFYISDDAYWDQTGYHPASLDSMIPTNSLSDMNRPDAQKANPLQPTSIITDRQAEALK